MSRWYAENEDPFSKVGYARVIVVKHNPQYGYRGKMDNCTHIVSTETFDMGFMAPEIGKHRYGSGGPAFWLDDSIVEDCAHMINHLFKDKKNGIYEMVGEIYHWSSTSYDGEWDGDTELRETKMREISFEHAMAFHDDNEGLYDDMTQLFLDSEKRGTRFLDTDIHYYMPKQEILARQAAALDRLATGTYSSLSKYKDSKVEDLENNIFMLMLQIDSERQDRQPKALEIDRAVKEVINKHECYMIPDTTD